MTYSTTTYEVTTRAGKQYRVESTLSQLEAANVILGAEDQSAFAIDIATRATSHSLSWKQLQWLQVLASWAAKPKAEDRPAQRFERIIGLLRLAQEGQKRAPAIKLALAGEPVTIRLARQGHANIVGAGDFETRTWFGKILADGEWRPSRSATAELDALLVAVDEDPAKVASQHGIATGECAFCARLLTTKESRSVGYGPICAEKYGLPWGHVDASLEAEGAKVLTDTDAGAA